MVIFYTCMLQLVSEASESLSFCAEIFITGDNDNTIYNTRLHTNDWITLLLLPKLANEVSLIVHQQPLITCRTISSLPHSILNVI